MSPGDSQDAGSPRRPPRDVTLLLVSLLIAYIAEAIGALASIDAAAFYSRLVQPHWAPPAWVFGPVWTALYTLMGVALWRVWRSRTRRGAPIVLFLVQLGINSAWSWLFFRWHRGELSFAWILLLLATLIATVAAFWRVSRMAALLLLPYLGWVSFAAALSWAVWRANPGALG